MAGQIKCVKTPEEIENEVHWAGVRVCVSEWMSESVQDETRRGEIILNSENLLYFDPCVYFQIKKKPLKWSLSLNKTPNCVMLSMLC